MMLALTLCLLPSLALCGLAPTYFGFWGPDAPSEMSTFSNLAFANTATEAVANSVHGIHSLLKLQDVFVNQTVRWHYRLNDDYAARWATLAPQVTPPTTPLPTADPTCSPPPSRMLTRARLPNPSFVHG